MKKLVALLLLLATVVSAQNTTTGMIDSATGNIVYSTVNPAPPGAPASWSGIVSTTSNGGGYSGGNVPGYNPNTGTFMFGYMQSTISYTTPISAVNFALATAGTGIQINGFRYSWDYLNQGDSRGNLSTNINFTNSAGQIVQNYNYNMPATSNGWTSMSGIENFNTQYAPSSLGNFNLKISGKDDRFWAGYYGPQIRAIDVGLLYSVQAPPPIPTDFAKWVKLTDENGEFTLTKTAVVRYGAQGTYIYQNLQPGTYSCSNSAWGRDPLGGVGKECDLGTNTTTTTPSVPKTTTTATTTTDYTTGVTLLDPVTTTTTLLDPVTTTNTPSTTATTTTVTDPVATTTATTSSQPSAVSPVVSAPAPATTTTTTTASSSSSSSSSTQSSTKESSSSSGGSNVGLALSVISKNSDRDAAGSAVAQTAVAQAQAAATQAQQEAASVASNAVSNSMSANAVSVGGQQSSGNGIKVNQSSNSTNFTLQSGLTSLATVMGGPQTTTQMFVQQQNSVIGTSVSSGQQVATVNTNQQTVSTTSTSIVSLLQPQQTSIVMPYVTVQTEQQYQQQTASQTNGMSAQTTESYALVTPNMLTDKTNPLTDIIEGKQNIPQNNTTAITGPVVNRNAQDNDVAGGVSINKMATSPAGYGDYLNFVMRDVAFYAPKEVYKNQRNVDNARALRLLTNDSKHKELVELQYAK